MAQGCTEMGFSSIIISIQFYYNTMVALIKTMYIQISEHYLYTWFMVGDGLVAKLIKIISMYIYLLASSHT